MSSQDKPGPTLDECRAREITHLRVTCRYCRHEKVVAVADVKARRDVPVNWLRWKCYVENGGCGRFSVTVAAITAEEAAKAHPIFDVSGVEPAPRRGTISAIRKQFR